MTLAALVGFLFGFLGSVPVAGPMALLVIRLSLNHDARHARYLSFGGALAEGMYVLLAFWGLSTFLDRNPSVLPASRLVGAVLCLVLAVFLLRYRPAPPLPEGAGAGPVRGRKRSFLGGFLITALNPTFLATWTAALTALHSTGLLSLTPSRAVPFALGVILGIVAWFSILLRIIQRFKERWTPGLMQGIVRGLGAVLLVASAIIVVRESVVHSHASSHPVGHHAAVRDRLVLYAPPMEPACYLTSTAKSASRSSRS